MGLTSLLETRPSSRTVGAPDLAYETNGAGYDFPLAPGVPRMQYILASTPRCGSNMIARGLWHTGRAGFPEEYLTEAYAGDYIQRFGTAILTMDEPPRLDVRRYLRLLWAIRTSPNEVFALKLHAGHLKAPLLEGLDVHELLREPRYIWLQRGDRVRQAISYALAQRTGQWIVDGVFLKKRTAGSPGQYSFEIVRGYLELLDRDVASWSHFFSSREVTVRIVQYEDLVVSYESTLIDCLSFLGVEPPTEIAGSGIVRQSSSINEDWYDAFMADLAEREPYSVWLD